MASNSFFFFIVILVITFVMYKAASGHAGIIENWGVTMVNMSSKVDRVCDGQSANNNNQQALTYNQNQIVNTNLLTPQQTSLLSQSLRPGMTNVDNVSVKSSQHPKQSMINSYEITSNEGYEIPKSEVPVYTVPGTYQANLEPRFNSAGLNSFVKYNLPQEKNLASYANDPLTMKHRPHKEDYQPLDMANMVEKPQVREDYQSCESATGKEYNEISQQLADQGNQVVDKLPVQPMSNSNSGQDNTMYQCADRYIFALQKSRLYGLADYIRGDIPVIPCLPNRNPASNTWFRPSPNVRTDLNAGALGIIGGLTNSTVQQTLELMANSAGGSQPTINGMTITPNTNVNPVSNVDALARTQYQTMNMGNQNTIQTDQYLGNNFVSTTAFP
jgi:hypothetical protein